MSSQRGELNLRLTLTPMNDSPTGATPTTTALPKRVNDLRGQIFGLLTVLEYVGPIGKCRHAYWKVRCSCLLKKIFNVVGTTLTNGDTRSCGCLRVEAGKRNATHGMTGTPEYDALKNAIQRCHNPKHRSYKDYGARGITVCAEWRASKEQFLSDMGQRTSPKHSLDRLDNDLGYFKANCAWRTRSEQSRNRRSNRLITYLGETLTITEWGNRIGVSDNTISIRLKYGWSIQSALTTPLMRAKKSPPEFHFEWA